MTIKYLPTIAVDLSIQNESSLPVIIPDLMVRVNYKFLDTEKSAALFDYTVLDGETPESISHKFYGTMDYHWVILLLNNRFDYISDWPMKDEAVELYCQQKYGVDQVDGIHHYEDYRGNITDEYVYDHKNKFGQIPKGDMAKEPIWRKTYVYENTSPTPLMNMQALPVTNREYETRANDKKRIIKLIKPQFAEQFFKEYVAVITSI